MTKNEFEKMMNKKLRNDISSYLKKPLKVLKTFLSTVFTWAGLVCFLPILITSGLVNIVVCLIRLMMLKNNSYLDKLYNKYLSA